MSTRATIWYGGGEWHLYDELMGSRWNVSLEFPRDAFSKDDPFVIVIPVAVWAEMRKAAQGMEVYLAMPPDVLRKEAEDWVDKRMADIAASGPNSIIRLRGAFIANPNDPREKQIEDYIKEFTPPRDVRR